MSGTRWVLVDDFENGGEIQWFGRWKRHVATFAHLGNSGPTYLGAQHELVGTSGSLSLNFTGSRVRLSGTSAPGTDAASGRQDPSWECFVDGVSIGSEPPFMTSQNNWPLCVSPELNEGFHVVTLNVTSAAAPFYLDQIKFLPSDSPESIPKKATVVIEQSDPTVSYLSGEWRDVNSSARATSDVGASVGVSFIGTKLSWIGWILAGSSGNSSASYSIDDGPKRPFTIAAPPSASSDSQFFQPLFTTDSFPLGEHFLKVTYEGPNTTALALDHVLIENGNIFLSGHEPLPVEPPAPSSTPGPGSKPPDPSESDTSNTPAIVGGVVGGAALLGLFVLALFFIRRRMKLNLPPIPFMSLRQNRGRYGGSAASERRLSFSEAMVRKPSEGSVRSGAVSPSLHSSHYASTIHSKGGSGYIPPNFSDSYSNLSPFASDKDALSASPSIPTATLTPLRRHMVVPNTIPE